jgi:hypothetical protein
MRFFTGRSTTPKVFAADVAVLADVFQLRQRLHLASLDPLQTFTALNALLGYMLYGNQ